MSSIEKRVMVNLTKEDLRILDQMMEKTGENMNILFKKALLYYHANYFSKQVSKP